MGSVLLVVVTACPSPRGGTEGTGSAGGNVFLHWISWDHGRWESEASPGAGWTDSALLGLDRCLWEGSTLIWEYKVYKGDCEYHVCFGQGIAYFFDMKAELGDKMLHMFHQFGILFPHQLHLIWASPISSAHPLPAYLCWCCSPSNNQASNQFPPSGSWGIAGSWLALSHGQPWTPQWLLEQCFWELQLLLIVPQLLIWAVFLVPGHVAWLY